jgi:hypothetical protein
MALTPHDKLENGLVDTGVESGSDDKAHPKYVEGNDTNNISDVSSRPAPIFEAPERIRNMTPEERHSVESSLKRKIDMRLMPMIILM